MKKNEINLEPIDKNLMDNLDFSIIGEVRGEEAYNLLTSMSSNGKLIDHREILKETIKNSNLFSSSETEKITNTLDELRKFSRIKPTEEQ